MVVRDKLEEIIGVGTGNADHTIPEALRMLAEEIDPQNNKMFVIGKSLSRVVKSLMEILTIT
jgi:hypothetical protein